MSLCQRPDKSTFLRANSGQRTVVVQRPPLLVLLSILEIVALTRRCPIGSIVIIGSTAILYVFYFCSMPVYIALIELVYWGKPSPPYVERLWDDILHFVTNKARARRCVAAYCNSAYYSAVGVCAFPSRKRTSESTSGIAVAKAVLQPLLGAQLCQ